MLWETKKKLRIRIKNLQYTITQARRGAFGFMIRYDETLQQGMVRNYQEFHDLRIHLDDQIETLKKMITGCTRNDFGRCEKCSEIRIKLDALLLVKEAQNGKTKNDS